MKQFLSKRIPRTFVALLATVFLFSFALGSTSSPVMVTDADTLRAALAAAASGDTILYDAGVSTIALSSGEISVPAGVTLQLGGGTLELDSGAVLHVYGSIANGSVVVAGGTLLRESGSSITAGVSVSAGAVRGACWLTLENLDPASSEQILSIRYAGESSSDTSGYVTRAANAMIYLKMTGSNFASYEVVETVLTDVGHVFRLGTKNTSTLSLAYTISYAGLSGATLTALNPSSYTASDSTIALTNPTKDGFTFDGWTYGTLGVSVPTTTMLIPAGTSGDLTFVANWTELTESGGMGGKSGGSTASGTTGTTEDATTTDDAETQQAAAAASDTATTQSARRTKVASSSTKVTFTSDVDTIVPTLESVRGNSFQWWWVLAGLAALGGAAWLLVKAVERKHR